MASPILQAVIFDVDGTLVDSERDGHREAFNLAFEALGLADRWDVETYGRLLEITGGQRRLVHHLRTTGSAPGDDGELEALAEQLHRLKTTYFTEMVEASRIPARPGVVRLLDELSGAGVTLAVATIGSAGWVHPLIGQLFGSDRFVTVVTGDEVTDPKPDPEAYLLALQRMNRTTAGVVAVEDSGAGWRSARAAGLACAVVANDYTRHAELSGADLVALGFGGAGPPRAPVVDRFGVLVDGVVDAAALARLVAATS